ncbi:hypothetical protein GUITHDRAFT_105502 [Guillardia theta CCMP2712]|uniref:WLM domain-containing protein n=1 Tax=Guillardia theta (strain CCMP2712) TaxID=905079 RepID=L1JK37_GUITC|nr:hypothetical protein GUITHDRAFT_105502 [Guillardia theta CCMP2712]EKX48878.1 hypothetical protein GUITHDRAFT_105502 [Guillardia theta CCMP2712]|eukprot:XP_005835858.1 hypothetical protein GUITHDRAFT_105502 [Guillardia theta CCMP2712]
MMKASTERKELSCFRQIVVLDKCDKDTARSMLVKAAKQVEPIMVKRNWSVGTLREFLPRDRKLLGLNENRGETISIRLRGSGDNGRFLEYHDVLGTLLHELVHNEVGPHNQRFYVLLQQLEEETESLMARGIVGVGPFECEGRRCGGRQEQRNMREAMLTAALKRKRQRDLMGSGRLGGSDNCGMHVRELAGRAAARRAEDDQTCRTRGEEEEDGGATSKRGRAEPLKEVIDLTGED